PPRAGARGGLGPTPAPAPCDAAQAERKTHVSPGRPKGGASRLPPDRRPASPGAGPGGEIAGELAACGGERRRRSVVNDPRRHGGMRRPPFGPDDAAPDVQRRAPARPAAADPRRGNGPLGRGPRRPGLSRPDVWCRHDPRRAVGHGPANFGRRPPALGWGPRPVGPALRPRQPTPSRTGDTGPLGRNPTPL